MRLERLMLRDFRNYERAEVVFSPQVNVLYGHNAQGKTNLLEAVYLLAIGKSFRTNNDRELARHGTDAFKVSGDFLGAGGVKLFVEYSSTMEGKSVRSNGVPLRRATELFGQVYVVLFSPDDLQLLKGGPEHRRAYLDLYLAQTNPPYRHALLSYHRLLAQRNEGLRRLRDGLAGRDELAVWNETLVAKATELARRRIGALEALGPLVSSYHQRLSGGSEQVGLVYLLGGRSPATIQTDLAAHFRTQLAAREREEIARGLTIVGPHRDDLGIGFAAGYDLRSFGSQGQQRTAALAMKLAAVDFLAATTGESPLVLLDDVLSEFDDARKQALLQLLVQAYQTVITATSDKVFGEALRSFKAFRVDRGRLTEMIS